MSPESPPLSAPSPPANPLPVFWTEAERLEWLQQRPHAFLTDQATLQRPLRQLVTTSATRRSDASSMAEDVWSVGVLLHWLVYGEGPDVRALATADIDWRPPQPASPTNDGGAGSAAPSLLVEIITACLKRQPERRPTAFDLEVWLFSSRSRPQ